jgi:acyl dehydratase
MDEAQPLLKKWAYEDLAQGQSFALGEMRLSAAEIIDFARQYDPQAMHIDVAAAAQGIFGGLAAAGLHVCVIIERMLSKAFIADSTYQDTPEIDFVDWKTAGLADDILSGECMIVSKNLATPNSGVGHIKLYCRLTNQKGKTVVESARTARFLRRELQECV